MKKVTFRSGVSAGLSIAIGLATGCEMPMSNKGSSLLSTVMSQNQAPGTANSTADNGVFQVIPAGAAFTVTGMLTAAMNLGAKSDQTYTLHTGNYSGRVRLTAEHDEIGAVDLKSQVAFTVVPDNFVVAPNTDYNFTVHVETTQAAPDFLLHYHVVARDYAGSIRKETQMETEFAVNPIFEITIGAGNALNAVTWSTDLVNAATGIGMKQPVAFSAHAAGVTVRFINMDPAGPHIVHGSGLIPHQNTGTPLRSLAPGGVNPAGKTYLDAYEVKVMSTIAGASGSYYLHDAESGAKSGNITFNVGATAVKPPVLDPTATFAKVNTTILQPKCVACHNASNPAGNVDLSSFIQVLKSVKPNDPASSSLYSSIMSNMPLGGTPLGQTDKDLVKNWISNGALNN